MFTRPERLRHYYYVFRPGDSCRVCIATVDGSLVDDVSALRLPSNYRNHRSPHRLPELLAWSPDGSRIAVRARARWRGWLYTIDRDGNDLRVLPPDLSERFDVESCSNGVTIPDPEDNPGLVEDCRTLLGMSEMLGGSVPFDRNIPEERTWVQRADGSMYARPDGTPSPITEWGWVELDGEPLRIHGLTIQLHGFEGSYPVLYGQIPPELGKLAELRTLALEANELDGHIPPELGGLANLRELRLSGNYLSGSIPPELGNLANLETLDLSDNGLTGSIPPELGSLANLETLDLSLNLLSGSIPAELGTLANLKELDLRGNQFIGCIPPALRDVKHNDLGRLGLSDCEQAASNE